MGASPTILFAADTSLETHGNFLDESYRAILSHGPWAQRLGKPHAQRHALPDERQADAKELDSCNSSDALLMNCFCYPAAAQRIFERLLPSLPVGPPEFGVAGNVPLVEGSSDDTEIDMRAGSVIFESKLTEGDFTPPITCGAVSVSQRSVRRVAAAPRGGHVSRIPTASQRPGRRRSRIPLHSSL